MAVAIEILKPFPVSELDSQDPAGSTALHGNCSLVYSILFLSLAAVHSRKKNLTALLLYKGAKPTVVNALGITPKQDASAELQEVFQIFEKEAFRFLI